jgi:hypothetical protein
MADTSLDAAQNDPMIYGYARVSTDGQSVEAQVRRLRESALQAMGGQIL